MKLHRLSLRNFQGVREFSFEPAGHDADVRGTNNTGKTTIASALSWVLFGKDAEGRTDFAIKEHDDSGEPVHNLEHQVEAVLELDDGRRRTLRKVYAEKWTRKRGQAERTFTGHETTCFLDDVPTAKSEYEGAVGEMISADLFRMLTDPVHFPERIHWKERRQVLLALCGDVTDQDVIESDDALSDLPAILGDRTMDELRKVIDARRAKINDELRDIPVRIDEKRHEMPDVTDLDEGTLKARLAGLRAKRSEAEQERARIEAGGEAAQKRKQLAELDAALATIGNRVTAEHDARTAKLRSDRSDLATERDDAKRAVANCDRDIRDAAEEMERLETQMTAKREAWKAVDGELFEHDAPETCSSCGQDLPADQIETAHTKALEAFNADKARRLTDIDAEGKRLRARYDELMEGCDERGKALAAAEHVRDGFLENLERLDNILGELQRPEPADDADYQKAAAAKQKLGAEIEALEADSAEALEEAADKVAALDEQISGAEGDVATLREHAKATERIKSLESAERKLTSEYEELERQLWLCDSFVRQKVSLLTERINSRFDLVRFKLFKELVNGGLEECCEVSVNGVPYNAGLNRAARMNAGLEVIDVLSEHFGVTAPIVIDNAEAVVKLRPTRSQQIRLFVDERHAELTVTVDETEAAEQAA